jgi:hypothetical protein
MDQNRPLFAPRRAACDLERGNRFDQGRIGRRSEKTQSAGLLSVSNFAQSSSWTWGFTRSALEFRTYVCGECGHSQTYSVDAGDR